MPQDDLQPVLTDFLSLTGPGSFVEARPGVMTDNRARWIWRNCKAELIEAGAALMIGGKVYVHPKRMDAFLFRKFRGDALLRTEPEPGRMTAA